MGTTPQPVHLLRFGVFEMNLTTGELRKNGIKIRLQEQPFTILTVLAMRSGELVTREELYSKLPRHGIYDAKKGLNNSILKIREALDDSEESPRFIETIRNRGYRFLPPVEKNLDNCDLKSHLAEEHFQGAISQVRQELLSACSVRALTPLLHQLDALIYQQAQHPLIHEAQILGVKSNPLLRTPHVANKTGRNTGSASKRLLRFLKTHRR